MTTLKRKIARVMLIALLFAISIYFAIDSTLKNVHSDYSQKEFKVINGYLISCEVIR